WYDPALPQARLAHHRHQLHRRRRHRLFEDPLQQREVDLPADEWRGVRPCQIRTEPRSGSQRLKDSHRLGLALHGRGLELLIVEYHLRGLIRGHADGDPHFWGETLQARCGVDRVAGQEPLARPWVHVESYQRLPCIDPDAQPKRGTSDRLQLLRRLNDSQAGPYRPLRVVLVCGWYTKHAHHGVTDELLHNSAMVLDQVSRHRGVVGE